MRSNDERKLYSAPGGLVIDNVVVSRAPGASNGSMGLEDVQ